MTDQARVGKVDLGSGKAQHVDLWRKVKLRRELLELEPTPGAAFVPFLGEADIAVELYGGRQIVGVELDPDVAETARHRLAPIAQGDPVVVVGDAETWHAELDELPRTFAIVDVDAFSNPYRTLALAWPRLRLADRVAIFGTDGMRLAIRQSKSRHFGPLPDGAIESGSLAEKRVQWNDWWGGFVRPYLERLVAPGMIVAELKYLRAHMLYWGVVVDRRSEPGAPALDTTPQTEPSRGSASTDPVAQVEAALLEAAKSGNVAAAIFWLEHRGGPTWEKPDSNAIAARLTRPIVSRGATRRR